MHNYYIFIVANSIKTKKPIVNKPVWWKESTTVQIKERKAILDLANKTESAEFI